MMFWVIPRELVWHLRKEGNTWMSYANKSLFNEGAVLSIKGSLQISNSKPDTFLQRLRNCPFRYLLPRWNSKCRVHRKRHHSQSFFTKSKHATCLPSMIPRQVCSMTPWGQSGKVSSYGGSFIHQESRPSLSVSENCRLTSPYIRYPRISEHLVPCLLRFKSNSKRRKNS